MQKTNVGHGGKMLIKRRKELPMSNVNGCLFVREYKIVMVSCCWKDKNKDDGSVKSDG
jgi:hypothetical protein